MNLTSYWTASSPRLSRPAMGPLGGKADVVIVGGGFTGLSAARRLAKKGISVVVLEAAEVASEASGRNGGHCNNGLAHDFSGVAQRFGLERAREMYQAFDKAVDMIEAIASEEAIDCDFTRSGKLKLAAKPEHFDKMRRAQEVLAREVDDETSAIPKERLSDEIGSDSYFGGVLYRRSASMHVGRFAVGLAEAALRAGAIIHEQTAVTRIDRQAHQPFTISTTKGTIQADEILLATGASQTGPFGWIRRRIVPVGSFIIVTEPLSDNLARSIMPGRRNCTTSQNIGNYFRMTADNRLVFGGRARFAMSSPRSDMKSGVILKRTLQQVFPQIADVGIDHCWGGLVDMTSDRLPRAGSRDGIHFSMGYSGHGVQMSTYMGDVMARRISGEDIANPWRDIDWPAVPFHFGKPWFLPFVGAYYRVLDRIQ